MASGLGVEHGAALPTSTPVAAPSTGGRLATAVAGLAIGATESVFAISFAGLVFAGPLLALLPVGAGLALVGALIVLLVTGRAATVPGTVGSIQDAPTVILAVTVAGVAARTSGAATLPTVLATIAVATVTVGIALFALGALRLGDLVRYVPFPVIGGFLAGSGWLITTGALAFLADRELALSDVAALAEGSTPWRLALGVTLGVVLLVGVERWGASRALPATLLGGTLALYLGLAVSGTGRAAASDAGWLLAGVEGGRLWPPPELATDAVDWPAVASAAPSIVTLVVICTLALLLNASGIELSSRRDVSLDRELRVAGTANVLAGAVGGFPGFQAVSLTQIPHRSGLFNRAVSYVAAATVLLVLLVGGDLIGWLPRPVLGGVLVFLGLSFLYEWLVRARVHLTRAEYGVVLLITATIAAVGVMQGVLVGVVATLVLFAVSYGRTDVVKHRVTSTSFRSSVDRTSAQSAVLDAKGEAAVVLELQGYLFFGTARRVTDLVAEELAPPSTVRYLVLDLRRVAGLDASTALAFQRTAQVAAARGVEVLVSGASPEQLVRLLSDVGATAAVRTFPDVDRAVEWYEDRLLARAEVVPAGRSEPSELLATELGGARLAGRLAARGEDVRIEAGTRLVAEGERADALYLLLDGVLTATVAVPDGSTHRLRTMLPGAAVGEVALYRGERRTASVHAETDAHLLRLSSAALAELDAEDPQVAAALHAWLARQLSERLARTLTTVAALRS